MKNFIAVVIFLILSNAAHAIPVKWDLNNIQLWDPGLNLNLLTGSFIYDADSQFVSSVSISGLPSLGAPVTLNHGFDASGDGSSIYFLESAVTSIGELQAYTGMAMLMTFTSSLTNNGGATAPVNGIIPPDFSDLDRTEYGDCTSFGSCFIIGVYDSELDSLAYSGGTLQGAAVPLPAAVWLFGSALAGLGWMRRKQTA
ncbi:MAG: VPLPA-CTERM sorting domain-containing protein [Gammaproteobacteria bacterium]